MTSTALPITQLSPTLAVSAHLLHGRVSGGTHQRGVALADDVACRAEVDEHGCAVFRQQGIGGFDIAVVVVFGVQFFAAESGHHIIGSAQHLHDVRVVELCEQARFFYKSGE